MFSLSTNDRNGHPFPQDAPRWFADNCEKELKTCQQPPFCVLESSLNSPLEAYTFIHTNISHAHFRQWSHLAQTRVSSSDLPPW